MNILEYFKMYGGDITRIWNHIDNPCKSLIIHIPDWSTWTYKILYLDRDSFENCGGYIA